MQGSLEAQSITQSAHQDTEGVTVGDLIVNEALQVNCLQLEVDGDVDQPIGGGMGEGQGSNVSHSYPMLTLQGEGPAPYQFHGSGLSSNVWTRATPLTPSSAGPLSPSKNQPPQEKRAVLVELQCEVLVTGAAIQEVQVLTGDVRGSVRRIHLDTV